jgi:hypothetical protein
VLVVQDLAYVIETPTRRHQVPVDWTEAVLLVERPAANPVVLIDRRPDCPRLSDLWDRHSYVFYRAKEVTVKSLAHRLRSVVRFPRLGFGPQALSVGDGIAC